jgi:hypothetical protein
MWCPLVLKMEMWHVTLFLYLSVPPSYFPHKLLRLWPSSCRIIHLSLLTSVFLSSLFYPLSSLDYLFILFHPLVLPYFLFRCIIFFAFLFSPTLFFPFFTCYLMFCWLLGLKFIYPFFIPREKLNAASLCEELPPFHPNTAAVYVQYCSA